MDLFDSDASPTVIADDGMRDRTDGPVPLLPVCLSVAQNALCVRCVVLTGTDSPTKKESMTMQDLPQYVIDALVTDLERNLERGTYLMGDGSERVVVTLQADLFAYVDDDEDWIGKVVECSPGGWYRHQPRPSGFDGAARKVRDDRGNVYWWQPPADAIGNDALVDTLRRELVNILSFGYLVGFLSVQRLCEFGDWHDVRSTSIGGLSPLMDRGELQSLVTELSYQIHDAEEMAA